MFTFTRTVEAAPDQVVRSFTEPEYFARWFVAEGFTTPADRVTIEVRPGGAISAVFVATQDGTEVPFSLKFGELDLPRTVVIHLSGPDEVVTVTLRELAADRTELTYQSSGLTPEQQAQVESGVSHMLDLLADSHRADPA
ncbi:SRPBCC domain-containing protein [Kribbella qitaiheensis]|uniref:SRPBCC family protein n=1 Tax=Kribbella qitaiheensis TaxID=1544730 RepID=UPI00361C4D49